MLPQTATFGAWFTGVVQRHELVAEAPYPQRRAKTWSERLALAMGEGPEYDSYLRRVAGGAVAPGPTATYRIGRGLRAAGLSWCSGPLALMRNPRAFRVLLALIDIASIDKVVHADFVGWVYLTEMTAMVELHTFGPNDEEFANVILGLLSEVTQRLYPAMESAFAQYESHGLRRADGLLGIAYQVISDKRSGPRASDAMRGLVNLWHDEIPSGSLAGEFADMFGRYSREAMGSAQRSSGRPRR